MRTVSNPPRPPFIPERRERSLAGGEGGGGGGGGGGPRLEICEMSNKRRIRRKCFLAFSYPMKSLAVADRATTNVITISAESLVLSVCTGDVLLIFLGISTCGSISSEVGSGLNDWGKNRLFNTCLSTQSKKTFGKAFLNYAKGGKASSLLLRNGG